MGNRVNDLTVKEAAKLIKENSSIKLIDVRTLEEAKITGFIKGSILLDASDPNITEEIEKLDKESEYLLYCVSGKRSAAVSAYMIKNGFNKLHNVVGSGYSELALELKN